MGSLPTSPRSLVSLLVAQTQVVLNDNAAKLMLIGLAQFPGILAPDDVDIVISLLPVLMVTPFIVLSPIAGWMCDRFSKQRMVQASLLLQTGILLALTLSLRLHDIWLVLAFFFLFAVQASLFSPAKRGILKELTGSERLARAVGWMEMLTVAAILGGSFVGGHLFDLRTRGAGDPWAGAIQVAWILTACSALALVVFLGVRRTPAAAGGEPYRASLWWRQAGYLQELWRSPRLFRSALGIIYFWFLGAIVYLALVQAGRELHGGGVGSVTATSIMLILLGLGTVIGNLVAGYGSRRGVELGLVPVACTGMVLGLVLAGTAPVTGAWYDTGLVVLGISGGVFLVPLFSYLQDNAGDHRRGRMLAAVNVLDGLGSIVASGCYAAMALGLGLKAQQQLLLLIAPTVLVGVYSTWLLPEPLVRLLLRALARTVYRVRVKGREHLPATGGALVICNHVSYVDALILQLACPRPLRFLAFASPRQSWWARLAFHVSGVISVTPRQATTAIKQAVERLAAGELVCIFPEGQISRTGVLMEIRKGFELVARRAGVPVVPVFLDRLWGSMFSFSGQKYLWKHPQRVPFPVLVNIGRPIAPGQIDAITARQTLLDLGEEAFGERPELRGHLGRECVRSLARRPWETQIVDCTAARSVIKAGKLLAVAAALSRRLAAGIPERRVGIVLPPSGGCCVANLAVLLAGKIPVNLNFTSGRAAIEACLRLGEINTVLTAEAVRAKVANFPWPEKTLDLRHEILACGKPAILRWLAAAWLLPGGWVASLLGLPRVGDREEVGLLFTSGTAGEPKGVVLSHRNILGNCAQISATGILPREEALLACLPIFHSFGFTATLWYPLLRGCQVMTTPSPLDTRRIVEVIEAERVTVMIGAPTFLRPLLKKANRAELRSLRFIVSGAEKMPVELYEAFKERFGIEVLQGYGLTETTPVTNVNLPDPPRTTRTAEYQRGHRLGSVGRLLPGMTARITDPETGAPLPLTSTGMLWLRGPNVFGGYLKDDAKTRAALKDDWFMTGDLGRFDEEGFLYIEGRLSRFSKIGAEMVPHGTVEQKIIETYEINQDDGPVIAIVGVPDSSKGEALVLLTAMDINGDDLRQRLFNAGLPNLWIPKIIRRVAAIPLLGSGKTDLSSCRRLAAEAAN
jgi:acyl-[acyl-carrier-protein]-phospholipid O-acyltransferase / long-chain-fatty-acid--[acyl-carrier-protein] ligase